MFHYSTGEIRQEEEKEKSLSMLIFHNFWNNCVKCIYMVIFVPFECNKSNLNKYLLKKVLKIMYSLNTRDIQSLTIL